MLVDGNLFYWKMSHLVQLFPFSQLLYTETVMENSSSGLFILKISASDPDIGTNGLVSFTLHGPNADKFHLDSKTGNFDLSIPLQVSLFRAVWDWGKVWDCLLITVRGNQINKEDKRNFLRTFGIFGISWNNEIIWFMIRLCDLISSMGSYLNVTSFRTVILG